MMGKYTTELAKTHLWKPQQIIQLQKAPDRYKTFKGILET